MTQLGIFDFHVPNKGLPPEILDYRAGVFDEAESDRLLEQFIREVPWQQRTVQLYGKAIITPRLTAWYGEPDIEYPLSGYTANPFRMTEELLMIRERIEPLAGVHFNGVLLNYYRDGNDSVAWHSDNDRVPGKNRIVASVSLGQVRRFDIRKTNDHSQKYSVELENGSYLLMKGDFQDEWEHRIAKSTKPLKPRINLTFRILK